MKKRYKRTGMATNSITTFSLPGQKVSEETVNSLKKEREALIKHLLASGYVQEHPLAAECARNAEGTDISDLDLRKEYHVGEKVLCISPLFHESIRIGKVIIIYPQLLVVEYNSKISKRPTWNEAFSKADVALGRIMEVTNGRVYDLV